MASTKTFADMKKPVRRPTPEEIAAFEETGRAIARERKIVAKAERVVRNTEIREHADTESREHDDTAIRLSAQAGSQEHGNPGTQKSADAESQQSANPETSIPVNTETRVSVSVVRLTIDLPEPVHTRFKTACAMTKRKMVEEVRAFIERRTAELERQAGRSL